MKSENYSTYTEATTRVDELRSEGMTAQSVYTDDGFTVMYEEPQAPVEPLSALEYEGFINGLADHLNLTFNDGPDTK